MEEEKGAVQDEKPRPKLLWPRTGRDWLLAGLLVFLLLGIVGNLLPEEEEVQVGAVRLKVPQGFEVREVQGGKALLAPKESPQDSFRENLTVLKEALPQPVDSLRYAQVVVRRNGQGLEAFQVGGVRPVQVLGVPGVAFAARGTHQGKTLEFQVVAFVLGGEGYQITLTGEPGKLAQYVGAFQEALAPLGLAQAAQAPSSQGGAPLPQTPSPVPTPQAPSPKGGAPLQMPTPAPAPGPLPTPMPYAAPGPAPDPYGGYEPALPYDTDPSGDLGLPDGGDSSFWDSWQQGEEFNTWMSEEWSQALSGETPDITHFDEQGNPYWEGPSGTLHEWDWGGWDLGGSSGDVP